MNKPITDTSKPTAQEIRDLLYQNTIAVETRPDNFILHIDQYGVEEITRALTEKDS